MKNICRYFVTDIVSVGIVRIGNKSEAYRQVTGPGWGVIDWFSETNNYTRSVNRDKNDKSQKLYCDEDSSAVIYSNYGKEFVISPDEEIVLKNCPKQSETIAIIQSDSCGFSFWEKEKGNIKIFVTYDENGLIENYRLDNWNGKPYEGETEIQFEDLQSEEEHDTIDRADIKGTFEYMRKKELQI
jgi:hypothetical protein